MWQTLCAQTKLEKERLLEHQQAVHNFIVRCHQHRVIRTMLFLLLTVFNKDGHGHTP